MQTPEANPDGASALPSWSKLETIQHADCRIFRVNRKRCRHPVRAREREFFEIECGDWVNVLAVTPDRGLLLVNQWRAGVERLSWELPGGALDKGEDPVAGGLRELLEETGFTGDRARVIGWSHPNPAIQSNRCHYVLVENARLTHPTNWDHDEELELAVRPVDWVVEAAHRGLLTHALTLNALFFLQRELAAQS